MGQGSCVLYSLILYWLSSHHLLCAARLHLQGAAEHLPKLERKPWAGKVKTPSSICVELSPTAVPKASDQGDVAAGTMSVCCTEVCRAEE